MPLNEKREMYRPPPLANSRDAATTPTVWPELRRDILAIEPPPLLARLVASSPGPENTGFALLIVCADSNSRE